MNSKRFLYFLLQLKRKVKMLPRVLALTFALLIVGSAAGAAVYYYNMTDESKRLITIGIVGSDLDDGRLIDACVSALNSLGSSNFFIKLVKMTEDEAHDDLVDGAISGYIVVPFQYAENIYNGRDSRLKYVSVNGASGVVSALISEIIGLTAKAGLESTAALYGVENYVTDRYPQKKPTYEADRLFEKYAALMLTRRELYSVKTVGVSGHSSLLTYLICGLMIEFLLLWGVSCSPLFRRNGELSCMLSARGLGAAGQTAGEAGAYVILMALCAAPVFIVLKVAVWLLNVDTGDFALLLSGGFIASFFLCAIMLCMMQLLLYELVRDSISAPLLQFLNAVVQGYICGCFYPQSFFPAGVRAVASHLPVGVAVRLMGGASPDSIAETVAYTALFFFLAFVLRRRAIDKWVTPS